MGIPKFYRWVSERYPCLSEVVQEHQIPEFDNLYFDMNGIIHTCSHPNDDDPHFRITEEQIFQDIFHYIEFLFRIIHPRKVFFMAVDGVAPRAKMNQQRGRRFMSAFTAAQLAEQAKKKGEVLPTEDRFDSNCITPGTVFMTKLHEQLKYFVRMKITTDETWRGIKIYLSGHDVPGEGEHKIMDFIRYSRSQSDYDPNTRHCLYGLDADLIMLGMCSHEPHFALLREEIKFVRPNKNQKSRTANPDTTKFHLLHLSLFREYLDFEFSQLKDKITFGYDLERIIDDWVLMGFLVGNDFIPHLPHLHIHEAALPRLYEAYCCVLPMLDGYINEAGHLNLVRFEKFMEYLAQLDRDHFGEEFEDIKWLDGKSRTETNMRDIRTLEPFKFKNKNKKMSFKPSKQVLNELELDDIDVDDCPDEETQALEALDEGMSDELKNLIKRSAGILDQSAAAETNDQPPSEENNDQSSPEETNDKSSNEETDQEAVAVVAVDDSDDSDSSDDDSPKVNMVNVYLEDLDNDDEWTPVMEKEFKQHKKNYYKEKMDYVKVTKEVLHEQAVKYVTAIQWNLYYYYDGCCSWSWYYPHHYSPYLSDVKGFSGLDLKFNLGEPFLPFQQLLAVLPAASRQLLPAAYQDLMTKSTSKVIDFYPPDFETDLNGKKNEWEAVVLIPFIEEKRLLNAMEPLSDSLTEDEKRRNSHGKHLLFTTSNEPLGVYPSSLPGVFSDIRNNLAMCEEITKETFRLEREKIVRGLLPGVRLDVYFPGFPTFKHIPVDHELKRIDVKVFQANSKNDSIVLKIKDRSEFKIDFNDLARRLIGEEIYVNWPHLSPGLVTAVFTKDLKIISEMGRNEKQIKQLSTIAGEKRQFDKDEDFIDKKYFQNRAVEIGEIKTLVHVKPLLGRKFICNSQGQVTFEKQWAEHSLPYALQTIVENPSVHDSSFHQFKSLDELYPTGCEVFLLGNPFYGHCGVVQSSELKNKKVHVKIDVPIEPDFTSLFEREYKIKMYWYPGSRAAEKLGVSVHFLSRITGTVYMEESRDNVENVAAKKDENFNGRNFRSNRYHIGLNLKFNKKNEEVPDYTRKDGDGVWWYSSNVLRILEEYGNKFAEIFKHMHTVSCHDDIFYADEIWSPEESKTKLKSLSDYLKSLPCYNAQHQIVGTDTVDERMIRALETEIERLQKANLKVKSKTVAVNPKVLFRPALSSGNVAPDAKVDYQLYDRVVNVRIGFAVPLGLRGTVVGIHTGQSENDMKLDVIFDQEFIGGLLLRGTKRSGYRIPAYALINLSYGARLETTKQQLKQRQQKREGKIASTVNTSTKKSFNPPPVTLPVGQNYDPLQFVAKVAVQLLPATSSDWNKSWVPKQLPPNPLQNLPPNPSQHFPSNPLQHLPSNPALHMPSTNQIKDSPSWVPLQPPPMPPSASDVVIERKFNPTEFVTKFAQPACLIPPRTVESLPTDPHSAFTQVQAGSRPQNVQPTMSYGTYNASRQEDRDTAWDHLITQNKLVSSEQQQQPFITRPPPSLTDVPPMHVPRAVRRTSEWVNSNFNPFYQGQSFNQGPPPPPPMPMFYPQHVPQMPMFFPQNANQMQAVQQHHQAMQQQQQAAAEAFRKNLSNVSSHNLFVPLQVTKKQPAPAYVKSAGNKQQKENSTEPNKIDMFLNSSITNSSNEYTKDSLSTSASGGGISLVSTSNPPCETSVRPKSVTSRTSRLAANFGNKT